ncbi:MAG: hypothetical protein M4579_005416 [Chaenotheca gracillima]|nr:MAG: hypothetical protein M4579_005416 [Chaenotheca gracillima]
MAVVPDSPPELTGSRSSKSSSFHSSSQFDPDGILGDISHFEDIGLDDDHHHNHSAHNSVFGVSATGMEKPNASKRSLVGSSGATTRNPTPNAAFTRELMNTRKSEPLMPLHGPLRRVVTSEAQLGFGLPHTGPAKRGFTSPSTPSLAIGRPARHHSRSPEPPESSEAYANSAPRRMSNGTPYARQGSFSTLKPPVRRSSWQPNRKSAQELENEYHDSDDDVPDDAIFYNVPCSPRPPQARASSVTTASPASSPERKSPLSRSAPRELRMRSPPASAPVNFLIKGDLFPLSPGKPALPRSATTSTLSMDDALENYPKGRVKSYTAALSELSEEAKALTEALEAHADNEGRRHEALVQSGSHSNQPRPTLQKAKTEVVDLPPLHKSNVMIDPLPVSREKEAVLTRTRPSWLPPKSQKEERKHLKEYQKMMALSREAELRRQEKTKQGQLDRDHTKESISRIWDEHVIPHWDQVVSQSRTRELWWRGVTPRSRAVVWPKAIRNELELRESSYDAALKRARDKEAEISHSQSSGSKGRKTREAVWFDAIRRDVATTYPELRIFQSEGPLHDSLVDVLMAYSMYRSDVGYINGLHLIAALLLLNLSPAESFISLSNILNRPLPLAFLTNDPSAIHRAYSITLRALAYKFPALHTHLTTTLNLPPEKYLEPMFSTLFTRNLSIDIASRIWDVYVFEGDAFLVRTAVAILGKLEGRLYGGREEVQRILGWESAAEWDLGHEDAFMMWVRHAGKEEGRTEQKQKSISPSPVSR